MIVLATDKELQDIWTKLSEVMERTKRHTKQIQELRRNIKYIQLNSKE